MAFTHSACGALIGWEISIKVYGLLINWSGVRPSRMERFGTALAGPAGARAWIARVPKDFTVNAAMILRIVSASSSEWQIRKQTN